MNTKRSGYQDSLLAMTSTVLFGMNYSLTLWKQYKLKSGSKVGDEKRKSL